MKEIKAQLSSDFLGSILPITAIDSTRDMLTIAESTILYDLWKKAETKGYQIPLESDRFAITQLKYKGYLKEEGSRFEFTKRGQEAIRHMILSKEENSFKKNARENSRD